MTWMGRFPCILAMSLKPMRICISASDPVVGVVAGFGASATTTSKESLTLAELLEVKGSMAVCLKKAVKGYGMVCHLSVSVW